MKFPPGFIWGAATSAHQVEGHNNNDWSHWEQANAQRLANESTKKFGHVAAWERIKQQATDPQNYISGIAAAHYDKYPEDIAIMKSLGLKAYRFSIEWSRLEPAEGEWQEQAFNHYREVIKHLKDNGLEPFVTLWHRTLPLWIEEKGGWENGYTIERYLKFVEKIVTEYKGSVRFWMPLNEPEFEVLGAYLGGTFPPQVRNPIRAFRVFQNLVKTYNQASLLIHKLQPEAQVGTAQAAITADAYKNRWLNKIATSALSYFSNWRFLNAVKHHSDFFGVQYYSRPTINLSFKAKNNYGLPFVEQIDLGLPKSDMGWEINPEGIYPTLTEVWRRYHKPIYVTENGLPDAVDTRRGQFIKDTLAAVHKAVQNGVDIRGYFHWSLLDNFEWDKGFWSKFGLIEVNRQTMERKVRPSAYIYSNIIKNS